jgi:hypothetical protein
MSSLIRVVLEISKNGQCLYYRNVLFQEGRVIPDWKKFISSGENIIRFLGDYIAKHIRQNSSLQEGQLLYLYNVYNP